MTASTVLAGMLVCASLVAQVVNGHVDAAAKAPAVRLTAELPPGVGFKLLASAAASSGSAGAGPVRLDRLRIDCGQVSGEIAGADRMVYVEQGNAKVHDWGSSDLLSTMDAGEAFGPVDGATCYLAPPAGPQGTIPVLGVAAAGVIGDAMPDLSDATVDCRTGVTQPTAPSLATVDEVFAGGASTDVDVGHAPVLYLGIVMVDAGAALGQRYASGSDVVRYASTGAGVVLPVVGGFGDGSPTTGGLVTAPAVLPGEAGELGPRGGVAHENFGPSSVVSLIAGVDPAGSPVLIRT